MTDSIIRFFERHTLPLEHKKILVGFSGGADSTALLHLLKSLESEYNSKVSALHFNHRIRGAEADRDEAFCRAFCEAQGIPFFVRSADVPARAALEKRGLEAAARAARYRALEELAGDLPADYIATAHNRNDNAETVLLSLARGGGSAALRGIPPVRGRIIRPLLDLPRHKIEAYCAANRLDWVQDSTNDSPDYARNFVRQLILPRFLELNPAFLDALSRDGESLYYDTLCLDGLADEAFGLLSVTDCEIRGRADQMAPLNPSVLMRLLRRVSAHFWAPAPGFPQVRAVQALAAGAHPSKRLSLSGLTARREYGDLVFGPPDNPQPLLPIVLRPGETVLLPDGRAVSAKSEKKANFYNLVDTFFINCGKMSDDIILRVRQPGDRFRKNAGSGETTLKKMMIEKKIPRVHRDRLLILSSGGHVLACEGIGTNFDFWPEEGRETLIIQITGGSTDA